MLDTIFGNGQERKQAQDELRALLMQARSERNAMRTMLEQASGAAEKFSRTNKALDELTAKAEGAMQKVEALSGMAAEYDTRAKSFAKVEKRVGELLKQVGEAEHRAQARATPEADLQQHRQTIEQLDAQAQQAVATLHALRRESDKLEEMRAQMQLVAAEIGRSSEGAAALKGELAALRGTEAELREEMQRVGDVAARAHGDSVSASEAVSDVAAKLESFAQLQALGKDTEKRLASLNALAEHVSHKAKALETQRHTVEHAVVEATRLNEMVWTMDAQIAKLSDGREQLQRTEEAVARVQELAKTTTQELATATAARESFLRESAQLETQGRSLAETLRATIERLAVDKKEFDAFDERLKSLSAAVGQNEARVAAVLGKDEVLAAMSQKADALGRVFAALTTEAEELARKQDGLEMLAEQLGQIDLLGKRTTAQHQSLMQSQQELSVVRGDLAHFHTAYAEAVQLRDKLAIDRAALDAFAERTATMLARTPDLEARLDSVLGKMSLVEQGTQSAARLGELTTELDAQVTRVGTRLQFVEKLEERVNGLHVVTAEVERKQAEQLGRRAEVEGLKNLCDSMAMQIVDAQQKLDAVAAMQGRLLPVTSQVAALVQNVEATQKQMEAMKKDEAVVHEQQVRFAELVEQGRRQSAEATERLKQVQAVSDDLGRAAALKEDLLAELARVQVGQREAVSQIGVAEDQLKRAEAMARQLEQRRAQLGQAEKLIAAFEGRLADLDRSAESVEQKVKSLADREALVMAVKEEVDNIRQISSKSRADLQFVAEHRNDVTELRSKVEALLGRVSETDDKIVLIESRRKMVEEVQTSTGTITSMLGDVRVNLEMLGEQRAVIDHVGEKLARLDFTVQEAQNTLRALQREREVAERIEQGIKALRTRSGAGQTA